MLKFVCFISFVITIIIIVVRQWDSTHSVSSTSNINRSIWYAEQWNKTRQFLVLRKNNSFIIWSCLTATRLLLTYCMPRCHVVLVRFTPMCGRLLPLNTSKVILETTVSKQLTALAVPTKHNKKGKVLPYSLPSVWMGADLDVQAVSLQVTF